MKAKILIDSHNKNRRTVVSHDKSNNSFINTSGYQQITGEVRDATPEEIKQGLVDIGLKFESTDANTIEKIADKFTNEICSVEGGKLCYNQTHVGKEIFFLLD